MPTRPSSSRATSHSHKVKLTTKRAANQRFKNGVIVNTIHCGEYSVGVDGYWQHGAQLAEGEFMNINQDKAVVSIKTPHDKILIELNEKLNRTYLWFGAADKRKAWAKNQIDQDRNAVAEPRSCRFEFASRSQRQQGLFQHQIEI